MFKMEGGNEVEMRQKWGKRCPQKSGTEVGQGKVAKKICINKGVTDVRRVTGVPII